MLAPQPHCIAAPEPGIEQHVEPDALARSDRPLLPVRGNVLLSPRADTGIASASRRLDARSRNGLTEFDQKLRHYCRHPKCRSKLQTPVENHREAFCARGCHSAFYRHRCLVCERLMERKTERQLNACAATL